MPLASLHDLYVEELRDLSSAEDQLVRALPKMAQAAAAPELRNAFERHLALTETHSERLGLILGNLGVPAGGRQPLARLALAFGLGFRGGAFLSASPGLAASASKRMTASAIRVRRSSASSSSSKVCPRIATASL